MPPTTATECPACSGQLRPTHNRRTGERWLECAACGMHYGGKHFRAANWVSLGVIVEPPDTTRAPQRPTLGELDELQR